MDDFRDHYWAEIEADITHQGWCGQYVFPVDDEGHEYGFTYTIGFTETYGVPEVIVSGLEFQQAMTLLHGLADRLARGDDIPEHVRLHEIVDPPYSCMLVPVDDEVAMSCMKAAVTRCIDKGLDFQAQQMLWPDADNHLPVQGACEPLMAQMQQL